MTTKKGLLFVVGLAISFGLCGLITSLVLADETAKTLKMDLKNAVQHIEKVKLVTDAGSEAMISAVPEAANYKLVGINTKNFVISKDGDGKNKINTGSFSNILGGTQNTVNGSYDSILGGSGNLISGSYSSILGGEENVIFKGSRYSTIVGGEKNKLEGTGSVVVGGNNNSITGDYSVTLGVDNTVVGNYSAALGVNSKVKANNSFLWTDSTHNGELRTNNVFAVVSEKGMVVNADAPHELAQLTIGGPLVIGKGNNDVVTCSNDTAGVMKVVDGEDNRKCLCGCDGSNWHSLYGHGTCEKKCNVDLEPSCGVEVFKCEKNGKFYFVGTCGAGATPVGGMGAYVVTKDNHVHRSCQTDDGAVASCYALSATLGNGTSYCG